MTIAVPMMSSITPNPLAWRIRDLLNWQAKTENLQDDVEVLDALNLLAGRLCPYKNISTSLFDKVKSDEDTQQKRIGNLLLSSLRHVSFRSATLTKHSARDGQADGKPELLFQHDGLGGSLHEAINHGKRRRSSSFHQDTMKRPADRSDMSEKFNGVRHRQICEKRKSPWVAEMTPKGTGKKMWIGSYKTAEAAARAADAAFHYYNIEDKLNFRDSPECLDPIPLVLIDKGKESFVKREAKRLAALAEMLPSTWDPENRSCNTSTEEFAASQPWDNIGGGSNFTIDNMQPRATNGNLVGLPNSDGVAPFLDSVVSDPEINLDDQPSKKRTPTSFVPSTSYGSDLLQEIGGSSAEKGKWLSTPNCSFAANSQVRAGVLYPALGRADMHTLTPVGNCSSEEATDTVFNAFTSIVWGEDILVPDIPGGIAGESASDIVSVEIPDISNELALHHEIGGETTFRASTGYDSSKVGESVQTCPNGDLMRDMGLFDWLLQ